VVPWITRLTQGLECLASKSRLVYWLASQYYRDVIEKEIGLANITGNDSILCIGGGACPFSAILFHQTTGARVTVIDNNHACISMARQVIDRLGLGGYVHVFHHDGRNTGISLSQYSVVHFALQVSPLERVFSRVEKQVAHGTKLLVRRPKSNVSNLYGRFAGISEDYCPHITHRKARNIGSTLLYVKGELSHLVLRFPSVLRRQSCQARHSIFL